MQHELRCEVGHRALERRGVEQIDALPLWRVRRLARRRDVQVQHLVAEREVVRDEVGPDEARAAGDQHPPHAGAPPNGLRPRPITPFGPYSTTTSTKFAAANQPLTCAMLRGWSCAGEYMSKVSRMAHSRFSS